MQDALDELQAEPIAVPPFETKYLDLGLAVHFRCGDPSAENLRIDIMSKLRGVDPFPQLWDRRTTIEIGDTSIDLLSVADLVRAKKTQRDKDWPMITRLIEVDYATHRADPPPGRIAFWLREMRSPELLVSLTAEHAELAKAVSSQRPLVALAASGDIAGLRTALRTEEDAEREADRKYWEPLKVKLEQLRRAKRKP